MKRVLLSNAYEAWEMAIKYCNCLLEGIATLSFQKHFVSSLHNAVELFMKQMMIDTRNFDVASIRRIKEISDAQLALKYLNAENLNDFFSSLSAQELDKFNSIEFCNLIEKCGKIVPGKFDSQSIKPELKLLQELRNRETHFLISESSFLTDKDFQTLYNFMIKFYEILEVSNCLPFWGEGAGEDERLVFNKTPLTSFSYKGALLKSKLALKIKAALDNTYKYGKPMYGAYDIAYSLCQDKEEFTNQFDKVWPIIEMFLRLGMVEYKEEVEEIPEDIGFDGQNYNVLYKMKINFIQ